MYFPWVTRRGLYYTLKRGCAPPQERPRHVTENVLEFKYFLPSGASVIATKLSQVVFEATRLDRADVPEEAVPAARSRAKERLREPRLGQSGGRERGAQ